MQYRMNRKNPLDPLNTLDEFNPHIYSKVVIGSTPHDNAIRLLDCIAELYPDFPVPKFKKLEMGIIAIQWQSLEISIEVSDISYVCWGTGYPIYMSSECSSLARDIFQVYARFIS